MYEMIITGVFTFLGVLIGGRISFILQKQKFNQDLKIIKETYKTEFTAEKRVLEYLNEDGFTDRSFKKIASIKNLSLAYRECFKPSIVSTCRNSQCSKMIVSFSFWDSTLNS